MSRLSRTEVIGFDAKQNEVERRMSVGEPFGSVEDMINGAKISEDEKAALWLLAWSIRDRSAQRRDARAMLARLVVIAD